MKYSERVIGWQVCVLLAVGVAVTACNGAPGTIAPEGLEPVERSTVRDWIRPFDLRQSRLYTIRPWRYRNERGAAAGRAAVRVVPPDSMRFDFSGPFRRSGKAAVVGDSALWVVPEDDFSALVELAPLFWTALGLPRMPQNGNAVFGLSRPQLKAWRYITAGDTLNFVFRGDPVRRISGEVRRGGRAIGVTEVEIDPVTGLATRARIDLLRDVSRFEFTVEDIDTVATFDASIWEKN